MKWAPRDFWGATPREFFAAFEAFEKANKPRK